MKFKVGDVVKDADGDDIRIVCVDKEGKYPVVGVWGDRVYTYTAEGVDEVGCADLVVPERPKVRYLAYEYDGRGLIWIREGQKLVESTTSTKIRLPSLDLECEVEE